MQVRAGGCMDTGKSLHWKLALGQKSLVTLGTWTRVSITPWLLESDALSTGPFLPQLGSQSWAYICCCCCWEGKLSAGTVMLGLLVHLQRLGLGKEGRCVCVGGGGGGELLEFFNVSGEVLVGTKMPGGSGGGGGGGWIQMGRGVSHYNVLLKHENIPACTVSVRVFKVLKSWTVYARWRRRINMKTSDVHRKSRHRPRAVLRPAPLCQSPCPPWPSPPRKSARRTSSWASSDRSALAPPLDPPLRAGPLVSDVCLINYSHELLVDWHVGSRWLKLMFVSVIIHIWIGWHAASNWPFNH